MKYNFNNTQQSTESGNTIFKYREMCGDDVTAF